MKKAAFKLVAVFVMILSLSTLSLNAEPTNTSHTVTLQKRPKQPKEHNQNLDRNGHRKPTAPVIVFFTTSDGIHSPYFEVADIISYSVLDDMGQTIFYTEDVTAFLNYIETCQSTIWIQLEFDDYYIEGWF